MSKVFLAILGLFFGMPEMHLAFLCWFWQCLKSFWPSVAYFIPPTVCQARLGSARPSWDPPSPRLAGRKKSISQSIFSATKSSKSRPFPGPKNHNFNKTGSRNQYRSIEHKKNSILTKSELPNPSGRPENAPHTFSKIRRLQPTSTDLYRPHPDPFMNHSKLRIWAF